MRLSYPDQRCTVASGGAHVIRGVLYTTSPNTWFLELPAVAVLGPSCNAQELPALCCWESPPPAYTEGRPSSCSGRPTEGRGALGAGEDPGQGHTLQASLLRKSSRQLTIRLSF